MRSSPLFRTVRQLWDVEPATPPLALLNDLVCDQLLIATESR
jgi:hypothetical protein